MIICFQAYRHITHTSKRTDKDIQKHTSHRVIHCISIHLPISGVAISKILLLLLLIIIILIIIIAFTVLVIVTVTIRTKATMIASPVRLDSSHSLAQSLIPRKTLLPHTVPQDSFNILVVLTPGDVVVVKLLLRQSHDRHHLVCINILHAVDEGAAEVAVCPNSQASCSHFANQLCFA